MMETAYREGIMRLINRTTNVHHLRLIWYFAKGLTGGDL